MVIKNIYIYLWNRLSSHCEIKLFSFLAHNRHALYLFITWTSNIAKMWVTCLNGPSEKYKHNFMLRIFDIKLLYGLNSRYDDVGRVRSVAYFSEKKQRYYVVFSLKYHIGPLTSRQHCIMVHITTQFKFVRRPTSASVRDRRPRKRNSRLKKHYFGFFAC